MRCGYLDILSPPPHPPHFTTRLICTTTTKKTFFVIHHTTLGTGQKHAGQEKGAAQALVRPSLVFAKSVKYVSRLDQTSAIPPLKRIRELLLPCHLLFERRSQHQTVEYSAVGVVAALGPVLTSSRSRMSLLPTPRRSARASTTVSDRTNDAFHPTESPARARLAISFCSL